jgi:hypothetical protein
MVAALGEAPETGEEGRDIGGAKPSEVFRREAVCGLAHEGDLRRVQALYAEGLGKSVRQFGG